MELTGTMWELSTGAFLGPSFGSCSSWPFSLVANTVVVSWFRGVSYIFSTVVQQVFVTLS